MANYHTMRLDHGDVEALREALERIPEPRTPREKRMLNALTLASGDGSFKVTIYDGRQMRWEATE